MRLRTLMFGCLAAGMLVASAQAKADSTGVWFVVSLDSASGTVSVESDLCMVALVELIDEQGFEVVESGPVSLQGKKAGMVYLLLKADEPDAVNLLCAARVKLGGLFRRLG